MLLSFFKGLWGRRPTGPRRLSLRVASRCRRLRSSGAVTALAANLQRPHWLGLSTQQEAFPAADLPARHGWGAVQMLKEASAPIMVQGRHWVGLRLAYKF